jgi:hypothetical protein
MAQVFNGQFIVAPSANVAVNNNNLANLDSSSANVLAILGTSTGGVPQSPVLITNPSTSVSKFISGPLLDGMSIAFDPSSLGGATNIYAVRVNSAIQSRAKVFDILNPVSAFGTVAFSGAVATGNTFTVTVNGVVFEYTATSTDTNTTVVSQLTTIINSSTSTTVTDAINGFTATAKTTTLTITANYPGIAGNSITLTAATSGAGTVTASGATLTSGTGNTLFTLMSDDYGLYTNQINYMFSEGSVSGIKATIALATSSTVTGATVILDNISRNLFSIQYVGSGSACTLTVNDSTLTTSATGAPSDNLNVSFATYSTIQQVIDYINSTGKYNAILLSASSGTLNSSGQFDIQTALPIKTGVVNLTANIQAVIDTLNSSSSPYVNATRFTNPQADLPAFNTAPLYMKGGSDGTSSVTDWANAINSLQTVQCQVVVPMSNEAAVHAAVAAHVQYMTANNSPRVGVVGGALGEYSSSLPVPTSVISQRAINLDSSRMVLVSPGVNFYNSQNVLTNGDSSYTAAFFGGLLAALPAGTPLTHKYFSNINGLEVNFTPADIDALLLSGVSPIQYVLNKGYRDVQSLTTYQGAANFAYDEISVVLAIDAVTSAVQSALDNQIVGQSVSPATLAQAVSITETQLIGAQNSGYIVGDSNSPAYQSISASANGDIIAVQFQMSPAIPANYVNITVSTTAYSGTVTSATASS